MTWGFLMPRATFRATFGRLGRGTLGSCHVRAALCIAGRVLRWSTPVRSRAIPVNPLTPAARFREMLCNAER